MLEHQFRQGPAERMDRLAFIQLWRLAFQLIPCIGHHVLLVSCRVRQLYAPPSSKGIFAYLPKYVPRRIFMNVTYPRKGKFQIDSLKKPVTPAIATCFP
jgi:hypothetical protein